MDINNIKLGKIQQKQAEAKKAEKETFQIPEDRTVSEHSLNKFRNSLAAYALAALSLSSCIEQYQYVDQSGLEAILVQMMQQNKEEMDKLNERIANLEKAAEQNNADNKEMIAIMNKQLQQQQDIYAILTLLYADLANFEANIMEAINKIAALAEADNANDAEFKALLEQILASDLAGNEKLDAILEANKEQNEFILNLTELVSSLGGEVNDAIKAFYEAYQNGDITKTELLEVIVKELKKSNQLSQVEINAINRIYKQLEAGQISQAEALAQITELLKSIDAKISDLIDVVEEMDDGLKDQINLFYEEYKNGEATKSELLTNIFNALLTSNQLSADQIEALKNIEKQMVAGQLAEAEALAQITELLKSIDGKLSGLINAVDSLGTGNQDLETAIKAFHNDFKDDSITENALLAKILEAIENYGSSDPEIVGLLEKIYNGIESGNLANDSAFVEVTDILSKINANTEKIFKAVDGLSEDITNLSVNFTERQDSIITIMQDFASDFGANMSSNGEKLDSLIKLQNANNATVVEISGKIDATNAQLGEINDKILTKDEVKDLLGPLYTDIAAIKEKIDGLGNHITIEDVQDIMNGYKTDLTKTNSLIETLTNVVQNLKLTGGDVNIDLSGISDLLKEMKDADANDRATISGLLEEAVAKLGNIEDGLTALQATANNILANQDSIMTYAMEYGADFMEEIEKIAKNTGDIPKLLEAAESYKAALAEAQQTRLEQKVILQAILEKEGTNNGSGEPSITIDELKDIIPDYTDILNEIAEKLGNVITSSDLENFFLRTQPDLTKTNALIETLTNVVQNKNFAGGSGSADMSRVESLLGQLIDAFNNKKLPTEAQIAELLKAAEQVVINTTATTPDPGATTRALADALADIQKQIDDLKNNKERTYLHPGWIYSHSHQA